jgi:methenyltetrahydrofolate cyclohydrolase
VSHQPDPQPGPGGYRDTCPPPGAGRYLDLPVGQFLAALSAPTPDPGGGAAAALAVALATSLCAMTASLSARQLTEPGPDAGWLARRAGQLRDEAAPLAQADADGYRAVLAAQRTGDQQAVRAALSAASDAPLRVAQIGAEVAGIAATVAASGNPAVRGDAITAALLAAAGARSAALLVQINLADAAGDGRPGQAARLATEAARLAGQASTEQDRRPLRS